MFNSDIVGCIVSEVLEMSRMLDMPRLRLVSLGWCAVVDKVWFVVARRPIDRKYTNISSILDHIVRGLLTPNDIFIVMPPYLYADVLLRDDNTTLHTTVGMPCDKIKIQWKRDTTCTGRVTYTPTAITRSGGGTYIHSNIVDTRSTLASSLVNRSISVLCLVYPELDGCFRVM